MKNVIHRFVPVLFLSVGLLTCAGCIKQEPPYEATVSLDSYEMEDALGGWTLNMEKTLAATRDEVRKQQLEKQVNETITLWIQRQHFDLYLKSDGRFVALRGDQEDPATNSGNWKLKGNQVKCYRLRSNGYVSNDRTDGRIAGDPASELHMSENVNGFRQPYIFDRSPEMEEMHDPKAAHLERPAYEKNQGK